MKKSKNNNQLFKIVLTSLLIAMNVVLEKLLNLQKTFELDISFGFIAVAFAAVFLGTPYAAAVGGLGDLIGTLLFSMGLGYFPGFTATNCIYGMVLAEFLYRKTSVIKIVLAVIINKITCTLLLNTLWISLMYSDKGYLPLLITRLPQAAIMTVVEIVVLILLFSNKSKIRTTLDKSLKKFI
ncbi:MAG: folate family ECF transporter S component [Clostridia bacterium]|nr:folate family ECF transporter S component [Clostridia bacterium]